MVRKSFSPLAGHSFVPCQFPVLSFIKHHGILHLFKNQYPRKTILVYREETEIYTTFKLSFAHCKTKTNPKSPKPKPTPNHQLWWSKLKNLTSFFWSMCSQPCYNFLSLPALFNLSYYHKKVEDEGSK